MHCIAIEMPELMLQPLGSWAYLARAHKSQKLDGIAFCITFRFRALNNSLLYCLATWVQHNLWSFY